MRGRGGAGDRTRTYDPIITNDVLYQLSYTGLVVHRTSVMAQIRRSRRQTAAA